MRLAFLRGTTSPWRGISAVGIMAAFLFTIALSDSPRLHEHLHKAFGNHQCAVTLVASGACHSPASSSPAVAPGSFVWELVFFSASRPILASALEFSRLEHAPPSFA